MAAPTILLLATLLRRSANNEYKKQLGLTSIAWGVIARLGEDGPMTQAEMVGRFLVDKGQLSRIAVDLAHKGLILRKSRNWRSIELRLASKGQVVFKEIQKISRARQNALLRGISRRDSRILLKLLSTISVNANALLNDDQETGAAKA